MLRWLMVLLALIAAAGGYYWLGVTGVLLAGLPAFIAYVMLWPPPRHRKHGLDQIHQAVDNEFGHFGKSYREDAAGPEGSQKVGRNDPCPCGSGVKYKRCCGRAQD